jgi:hypothetical protein
MDTSPPWTFPSSLTSAPDPWTFHGQVETNKTSADHKVGFPIFSDGSVMVRTPSLALTDLQKWHLLGDWNHGMSHDFPRKYWEWKSIPTDELSPSFFRGVGRKTTNQIITIINHH